MNERVLELAKQAGLKKEHGADREYIGDFDWREFAELIVRQCIHIACEYDKPKLSGSGHAIASYIESHFDIYIGEDGRFVK